MRWRWCACTSSTVQESLPILEAGLSSHRGQKSVVTDEALLLAILLAAWKRSSYRRTDLCAVLNGLDPRVAVYLGLCDSNGLITVSYKALARQILRLEKLLYSEHEKRLTGEEGDCCDLQWLADKLVPASMPPEVSPVDRVGHCRQQRVSDIRQGPTTTQYEAGKRRKLPKDKFAEYLEKVLENPELGSAEAKAPQRSAEGAENRRVQQQTAA